MRSPRSVNELVEQQVLRWQAERKERAAERKQAEHPPPIITISREAGSRGTDLGRAVADKLGFRFWDQELVHQIAEQTGASEMLLRAVDEHARSAIEDLVAGALMGNASTEKEYFSQLMRVIHTIARHGSAVVIGRGAQFVLPPEQALRVRVIAPLELRVKALAALRGLEERYAQREVERLDRERAAFMRHHYDRELADVRAYDLIVNVGPIPLERAADVVVAAYRAKFES